jgi:hypothetical protein
MQGHDLNFRLPAAHHYYMNVAGANVEKQKSNYCVLSLSILFVKISSTNSAPYMGCTIKEGCGMSDTTSGVSPKDIQDILDRAAKAPGINDVMALLQLSREVDEVERIKREATVQPIVSQSTGTSGWVL